MSEAIIDLLEQWWQNNGNLEAKQAQQKYASDGFPLGKIESKIFNNLIESFIYSQRGQKINSAKIIQINDIHIPFQDKLSVNLLYKFLADFLPNQIVIAGDMLDFYELSSFDKDPKRKFCIQDEIDQCYEFLKELKQYCDEIHFIKGNHEDRLRRFLWKNPSLASIKVLELPKLLNLDSLGIFYHDFEYIYNNFRFTHGTIVRQESGATAKAELLKYGTSMASGHTHRLGMYLKTDNRGTVAAYEGGCLCDLRPEYVSGVPNWTQGFIVYNFIGNRFFAQPIPIIDHKFIYGNKKYE